VLSTIIRTVVKLAILSVIVGFLMAMFDIRPRQLFASLGDAAGDVLRWSVEALGWAWSYMLLGAAVVVPLWLVVVLVRRRL
jgi:uncharacterized protein DUF6460